MGGPPKGRCVKLRDRRDDHGIGKAASKSGGRKYSTHGDQTLSGCFSFKLNPGFKDISPGNTSSYLPDRTTALNTESDWLEAQKSFYVQHVHMNMWQGTWQWGYGRDEVVH